MAKSNGSAVAAESKCFSDELSLQKSTPGTVVYGSEIFRTIYIPKEVVAKISGSIPKKISVSITAVE